MLLYINLPSDGGTSAAILNGCCFGGSPCGRRQAHDARLRRPSASVCRGTTGEIGESWQRQQNPENGKNNNPEHVKYLDVRAVLVEGTYVIGVAWLESDVQQRRRWWPARRRLVLWGRRLVENGAVFKTPQIERAQRAVHTDRHEDDRRVGQPRDVVHLTIVCNKLRHRHRRVQIPKRTRGIDRGCDYEPRSLLIP
jgi:hypothetical protein